MDPSTSVDDYIQTFYVGQHESRRALPVTEPVLRQAQDCNVGTRVAVEENDAEPVGSMICLQLQSLPRISIRVCLRYFRIIFLNWGLMMQFSLADKFQPLSYLRYHQ